MATSDLLCQIIELTDTLEKQAKRLPGQPCSGPQNLTANRWAWNVVRIDPKTKSMLDRPDALVVREEANIMQPVDCPWEDIR